MNEDRNGSDVEVEVAGQKVNIKNVKSLNTGLTFIGLLLTGVLCYAFYVHAQDTQRSSDALVLAMKEQTVAMKDQTAVLREQNCLTGYQGPVAHKADFCKQMGR